MKRGKRRIDDAIVLANGIGIISGKTSYILKEKKENEEDKIKNNKEDKEKRRRLAVRIKRQDEKE